LLTVGDPTFQCLHQHLKKYSQFLQHILRSGFDSDSHLTSAWFSFHFTRSLSDYHPP
jgi:hypothetical protein